MNKRAILEWARQAIKSALLLHDNTTYWYDLGDYNGNRMAIVIGWQSGYDHTWDVPGDDHIVRNGFGLCAKLAYISYNSAMSEYDIDWIMPYDKDTSEVDDTEMLLTFDDMIDPIDIMMIYHAWEERYKE